MTSKWSADVALSWIGRIWIALAIAAMTILDFAAPRRVFEDWALFHIGWVPIIAMPNPANVVWWVATVALAAPGIGALVLSGRLRRRGATLQPDPLDTK